MALSSRSVAAKLEQSLPMGLRRLVGKLAGRSPPIPPLGRIRFGDLRRLTPIEPHFGYGRGRPVDRYYIENFLQQCNGDIIGHVLEIGDNHYTRTFGGAKVTQSSVLHVTEEGPGITYVGSLETADHLPSNAFDCVILTQTLHLIYDFHSALRTVQRILKSGGKLLMTSPGISQIDRGQWRASWHWSFTPASVRRMLDETFGPGAEIESHGNVLAAIAFLQGLAAEELSGAELDHRDNTYPVVITARIIKR